MRISELARRHLLAQDECYRSKDRHQTEMQHTPRGPVTYDTTLIQWRSKTKDDTPRLRSCGNVYT